MKLGPKEIKVVNEYFVRPVKNRLKEIFLKKGLPQLKNPDEIQRPQRALDKEAIDAFMKRNPMADGGRINFDGGGSPLQKFRQEIVESMKPYAPGDVTEDQLQLVVKDITLDMTAEQAQASALSNFRKLFGMADGGRISFQEAGFVISSNQQKSKLKFSKKQDALAKEKYGMSMKELYEKRRNIFHDIRLGRVDKTTQAGKGAKVKSNIQIPTKDVRQPDGKIKKVELPVRYPNKEVEKKFKKSVRNIFKKPAGNIPFKTLAKDFPITERQAIRAAKQIKKEEGLQYAKGRGKTEYIKEVREPLIKKTDSPRVLKRMGVERARFLKDKPEVFGKIDTAHRASKSHMARLGLQFDTQLVGMDSRLINQVVLKPAENMLDKLYEKRENILDNIKGKPTKEQKKTLQEINDSVKKVVKTTSGRFVGIIVDPNNLEPSFSGIKKNLAFSKVNKTMKEIEKLPGAPTVTGGLKGTSLKDSEYFNFIKDNVQKSVSGEIKRGFVPNDFKVILSDPKNRKNLLDYAKKNAPDILPQFKKVLDNPTSKQSLALYANPMFSPGILKEAFKQLPTPAAAVGINLLLGVDPTSAVDRASIAAEAAFAPQLVKQAAKLGTVGQKIANLGLTPAMAARAARIASPLGIASLAAEGLYQGGKFTKKRIEELRSMTPEQREELRRQGEAQAFDPFQAAGGGIAKQAGDRSGPMLKSMNPDKDGLLSLMKRGKKI
jgi:hypothetical protein